MNHDNPASISPSMIKSFKQLLSAPPRLAAWLSLACLLAVGYLAFLPGTGGIFMIDDYENLRGLEDVPSFLSWESLRYIFGNVTGSIGRPLSLLTFAAQHSAWPLHPGDFIYVGILLHLLNAALFFSCLLCLSTLWKPQAPVPTLLWIFLATWLWTFASLHTGAVLYVVQRMTVLSGTCQITGLLLYLHGRRLEIAGRSTLGIFLMLSGLFVGTALGILAKENAALFPFLLLCLECTILQNLHRSKPWKVLYVLCCWLPASLVCILLLAMVPGQLASHALHHFTFVERLLTEPRVLFMYLQKFIFPPLYGLHLYYDDLEISRNFLTPWITAFSLGGLATLLGLGFFWRLRFPVFALAVFWYLAAQVMESTVIPLELAFDHRNYVALLGPCLAMGYGICVLLVSPGLLGIRKILACAVCLYMLFVAFATWQCASFWGNPWEMVHHWGSQQPASRRAQQGVAQYYWQAGKPQQAIAVLEKSLQRWPGDISFFLKMVNISCAFPDQPMPDLSRAESIMEKFDGTGPSSLGLLEVLVTDKENGSCPRISTAELWGLVQMVFANPKLSGFEMVHLQLLARIAALAQDAPEARFLLDKALKALPFAAGFERAIHWSIEVGDAGCANMYLEKLSGLSAGNPMDHVAYHDRILDLRKQIAAMPPSKSCQIKNPGR